MRSHAVHENRLTVLELTVQDAVQDRSRRSNMTTCPSSSCNDPWLAQLTFASRDVDKSWEVVQIRLGPVHLAVSIKPVLCRERVHVDTLPWMGQQPPPAATEHSNKVVSIVQMGLSHDRMWAGKPASTMGSRLLCVDN